MTNGNEGNRLDRIEAILENFALGLAETRALIQSNAKSIEALTSDVTRDRRQTDAQLDRTDRQISQLTRDVSTLAQHQATMFEIVQELSKDRVTLSENLASIAQSLARLAGGQQP